MMPELSEGSIVDRFDRVVDEWWEHLRGRPLVDRVFYTASELADFSLLWHLSGVGQGVVRPDGFERAMRTSAMLGLESALVNGPIKSLFRRTRPVHDGPRPHTLRTPRTSSFPSGHASAAFLAAALLSENSRVRPLWYAAAVVVGASRVHVRIHHASDVLAGAALGATLGLAAKRAWPVGRPNDPLSSRRRR
jgi:membrane-associated phospholipid phosphatase